MNAKVAFIPIESKINLSDLLLFIYGENEYLIGKKKLLKKYTAKGKNNEH